MCRSSNVLWGRGVLLPHFTDGMVGQRGTVAPGSQMLPLMEKHQSFLPVIPPQRCPSLCARRSIRATTNQTLNQRPSCVKTEIFSSFVEGGLAGAVPAHVCPALGPRGAPLLTALLLLVAALDFLSREKPMLKPLWDFCP